MAERIEIPGRPTGTAEQQLEAMYNYLYKMAQTLNININEIGDAGLTDDEQVLMNQLTAITANGQTDQKVPAGYDYQGQQTLKSLIIKTAEFVKTSIDAYKMVLFGETEADSEQGNYRLKQGLRVDVNPEGIKQTYSFAEVVKGLKTYEINAKNYIKTGYLRTENSIPIYGVAIGKDVVTFDEDGVETYNDGNKVAELTADALSFFSNGTILAKYAGTKTSFYSNNTEVMYIQGGKIYAANDMYIGSGKNVFVGDWRFNSKGLTYYSGDNPLLQLGENSDRLSGVHAGVFMTKQTNNSTAKLMLYAGGSSYSNVQAVLGAYGANGMCFYPSNGGGCLGHEGNGGKWTYAWISVGMIDTVEYQYLIQVSSRDIKHDIRPLENVGDRLDQLQPVTFVYDSDPEEKKRFGLIYEDTMDVMPEICTNDEGQKAINYVEMIPMLLKEIQDLRARVSELERR